MPSYIAEVGHGKMSRKVSVPIPEAKSLECPMSVVQRMPEIAVFVDDIIISESVRESSGVTTFGPDPREWPIIWFDGVRSAQSIEKQIDEAVAEMSKTIN